jgi:ABC-2 type transport system ATP-binding protein
LGAAIETKNLTKTYKSRSLGNVSVVDQLNLAVEEGEIFGFLGPNGAGKTTTIKMLLGIIYPTSGEGYVLGKEIGDIDVHRVISYLPERPYYYEHMTGMELLKFYDSLFGSKDQAKCQRLLERVGLAGDASKTISQYSKGMQQRVGLAQSLLNDPKVMFMDEPTSGLDPNARIQVRGIIESCKSEGRTVFISTHELSEAQRLCDRVAIIHRGKIVRQGAVRDLLRGSVIELSASGVSQELADKLKSPDITATLVGGELRLEMPNTADTNSILDAIRSAGGSIRSLTPRDVMLEDLFREVTSVAQLDGQKQAAEVAK